MPKEQLPPHHPMYPVIIFAKVPKCVRDKLYDLMARIQQERSCKISQAHAISALLADEYPDLKVMLEGTPYDV